MKKLLLTTVFFCIFTFGAVSTARAGTCTYTYFENGRPVTSMMVGTMEECARESLRLKVERLKNAVFSPKLQNSMKKTIRFLFFAQYK